MISEFLNKIIDPFRCCAITIPRYHLNPKLKVIIITLLISFIAYIVYQSIIYYTLDEPLYCATYDNDMYQAKRLLKEGVDPNKADWKDGATALQAAEENGNKEMVKLLIKYGAKD